MCAEKIEMFDQNGSPTIPGIGFDRACFGG